MRYPEEIVEEVRLRNDIVDVIGSSVRLTRKGSSYFGLCPFHNEKSPSFSVSPSKQIFYCFGCGVGGNVISFVMKYENYTFSEAVKFLADRAGIKLPEVEYTKEQKERENKRLRILEANREAATYFYYNLRGRDGQAGLNYLKGRELSEETMKKFGLGFSLMQPDDLVKHLRSKGFSDEEIRESGLATFDEKRGLTDKFWNRVMYPIQDINHRVIAFGGRVMSDAKPKYLNSPETMVFDKSRNLYGLNFARTSRKDHFILCEGYMDVIAMHQAGFTEAVASLGTAFTPGQATILKRYSHDVYLAYDSDGAGRKAALRAIEILRSSGMSGKVINMTPYKDPDEFIKALGTEEFQKRIDEAENSFFFELRMEEENFDLSDPDGRTRFLKVAAEKLVAFEDEIERESYITAVAKKYSVSYESLKNQVVSLAARNGGEYKPIEKPKPTDFSKADREDAGLVSQRLLLTWLCEQPSLYEQIKDHIKLTDFTDPVYQKVAEWLFKDIEEGTVNPGAYVSRFEDEEEQAVCAAVFNTKLSEIEGEETSEKAFGDIVYKVKKNSIDVLGRKPDQSVEEMMAVLNAKKELEELKKVTYRVSQ
ncbi:MAG: DNA primase [Lachnospiraceae bacterium]|nr:DNA primase [Lachnospiraceae bacterium]